MLGPIRTPSGGHAWSYYKKTFLAVQLAVGRAAAPDLGPAATVFIVMQVSAVIGSIWANRLRRKMTCGCSRVLN